MDPDLFEIDPLPRRPHGVRVSPGRTRQRYRCGPGGPPRWGRIGPPIPPGGPRPRGLFRLLPLRGCCFGRGGGGGFFPLPFLPLTSFHSPCGSCVPLFVGGGSTLPPVLAAASLNSSLFGTVVACVPPLPAALAIVGAAFLGGGGVPPPFFCLSGVFLGGGVCRPPPRPLPPLTPAGVWEGIFCLSHVSSMGVMRSMMYRIPPVSPRSGLPRVAGFFPFFFFFLTARPTVTPLVG